MIHIAYCFDRNYRAHFGASVTSLLLNSLTEKKEILIHVLTDEVDQEFENSLHKLRRGFGVNINTYIPTAEQLQRFSSVPLFSYIPITTYFRLLLPELLPSTIDKLLYIDTDTIVLADIAELYNHNLEGCTLAGVLDYSNTQMSTYHSLQKYINSGVLLFDIKRWLSLDYTTKCIDFANLHPEKIYFADQCLINHVLQDDITLLASSWNRYIVYNSPESDVENAAILHFITADKPWQEWYESPVAKYYWQYLAVSPWKDTKPILPRNFSENWRYARKLGQSGRLVESINAYENILHTIVAEQKPNG